MTKQDIAERYRQHLAAEGYAPWIDEDGDVVFRCEGRTYCIIIDEDEPTFFRLIFPNFWPIESDRERIRALQAAHEATRKTKVAKVIQRSDDVWATIELFVGDPEDAMQRLQRSLSALRTAVRTFAEVMDETAGAER